MYSIYITETGDELDSGIVFPNSKFEAFLVQRFGLSNCPSWPPGGANVPRARVCTRDDSIILMDHRIQQTGLHLQMFIYYKYTKRQTNL